MRLCARTIVRISGRFRVIGRIPPALHMYIIHWAPHESCFHQRYFVIHHKFSSLLRM